MVDFYSSESFEAAYTYSGTDLGAVWSSGSTFFRLWAPTARSVSVKLYESGTEGIHDLIRTVPMAKDVQGTWIAVIEGDLHGIYYTYLVTLPDRTVESVDPYARAVGVNGRRAMVIDLARTNPAGWEDDRNPHAGKPITDAVIYEMHIRDFSISASSGIRHRGKYPGVTETDTHTGMYSTGLDHILELGVTHVQLMPVYDFGSVDEYWLDKKQYNWGYDPENYNVPEGSYSTDPFNGAVRVEEMKHMVKLLHAHGLGVIMDVVYNHVYHTDDFSVNKIVPGYFSRGQSNASGCGNDTASERSMVRKYIVDSLNYWADEYHIDGFRFDLSGLLDTRTIREAMESVHKKHPDCLFYGEGWYMDTHMTKPNVPLANQGSSRLLPGFGFFNDAMRDALRGSVFSTEDKGFAAGNYGCSHVLQKTFLGAPDWVENPGQTINYISCHDNHTLFDRLALSLPGCSRQELIRRNNLAAAICLLSQGVPLMLAGEELLRTKPGRNGHLVGNSYRSPDSVNSIKWNTLKNPEYRQVFRYYQGLIAFRKAFPVLRQTSALGVKSSVFHIPTEQENLLAFLLYGSDYRLVIAFNAGTWEEKIMLPKGDWQVLIQEDIAGTRPIAVRQENTYISPLSALALYQHK